MYNGDKMVLNLDKSRIPAEGIEKIEAILKELENPGAGGGPALVSGDLPLLHFLSHRPKTIPGLNIPSGPTVHLHRRSAYLPGTTVPPASSVSLSAWDHGPTCIAGQVISLGPRSHLHRRHIIS